MADEMEVLRVDRTLAVPVDELRWRFTASGGPGGQHANTANTKVELRFDVAGSPSLSPAQRDRLLRRYGPELRVVSTASRSQARNRRDALTRLRELLAAGVRAAPARVATRPSAASVNRRLEAKRHQARRKQDRRPPPAD